MRPDDFERSLDNLKEKRSTSRGEAVRGTSIGQVVEIDVSAVL